MVVQIRHSWRRLGKQIGRPLVTLFVSALVLTLLNRVDHPFRLVAMPDLPISIVGAVLGILLGFRTSTAYARWWEARTMWGALVNYSRTLARQAISFGGSDGRNLVYHQIAFVHALRCHLRRQEIGPEIEPFLDEVSMTTLTGMRNIPSALLRQMGEFVARMANRGEINELRLQRFDDTLTNLTNILGACERIKNTPLPRQYDYYPELFVMAYCYLLPLVLVDQLGWFTPFVVPAVAFVFLVLNRIGKNLEDPFENTVYDVPLLTLSRSIEIDLRQALGETTLPESPKAVNGVLW